MIKTSISISITSISISISKLMAFQHLAVGVYHMMLTRKIIALVPLVSKLSTCMCYPRRLISFPYHAFKYKAVKYNPNKFSIA